MDLLTVLCGPLPVFDVLCKRFLFIVQTCVNSDYELVTQWVTSTFDLAFRSAIRWAKVRSKSRLKSKSKVVSLSQSLRPNFASSVSAIGSAEDLDQSFGLSTYLDRSQAELTWLKSVD